MARQLTPLGRVLVVLAGLSLLGYGLYKYGDFLRRVPGPVGEAAALTRECLQ